MPTDFKSNIKIKSNVYLLSDTDHPEKDAVFVSQVFSAPLLTELKKRADDSGAPLVLSDIQKRIMNGEQIKLSEIPAEQPVEEAEPTVEAPEVSEPPEMPSIQAVEHIEQTKEDASSAEMPSIQAVEHIEQVGQTNETDQSAVMPSIQAENVTFDQLLEKGFGDARTIICCSDIGYAGYVGFLLHKNAVPYMSVNKSEAPSLMRHFADVLWDCNDKVISRDSFDKRFTARCSGDAARADECFDALCKFAGASPSEGLELGALAEKIMRGEVPDTLFSSRNAELAVAAAEDADYKNFERVYLLENGYDEPDLIAESMSAQRLRITDCPSVEGSVITDSTGKAAVGIEDGDVDCLSFIGGTVGDAVRKQAYISQNVRCNDEVRLELNGGVYDIVHNKMVIAKMSEAFSQRVSEKLERLPQSLGGLIVFDVVTVVSCRGAEEFGEAVPPQFRDRNFWLGVELGGFAREL